MDLYTIGYTLLFIIVISLIWYLIRIPSHPINILPGPKALPLFGSVFSFQKPTIYESFKVLNELAEKNNYNVYRTWLTKFIPIIHPLNANYLKTILSSSTHITKGWSYRLAFEWLGNGLLLSGGSKWHSRRKLLTPAFHFSILEQFVPIFNQQADIMIKKLEQFDNDPNGVDLVPYITLCTLDIICETAMGYKLNAQSENSSEYVNALHKVSEILKYRIFKPLLLIDFIFHRTKIGRIHTQQIKILHDFTDKVIKERKEIINRETTGTQQTSTHKGSKKIKAAFLDLLLKAREFDSDLTDKEIRAEVDTFMFEGHDTTSMGISWTLFYISANPHVQDKCIEEINDIFNGSSRDVTISDFANMTYLDQVIKESLRIRPPVHKISRKIENPLQLENLPTIPPGTYVEFYIYDIHHNPLFFPDPETFDPERFAPDNVETRNPFAYIPFSAGPRNCIGQRFAMYEMKTIISTVLRHYRIESSDPVKYSEPFPEIILRPRHGLQTKLYKRS